MALEKIEKSADERKGAGVVGMLLASVVRKEKVETTPTVNRPRILGRGGLPWQDSAAVEAVALGPFS